MIKSLKVVAMLAISALLSTTFYSCDEDDDSVSIAADKVSFDNEGGTANVYVSANASWVLSGMPSWLSVEPAYGNGDQTLVATASANGSYSTRSVILTVKCGTATDTISFFQAAAVRQPNENANDTTGYGSVVARLEMPRLNALTLSSPIMALLMARRKLTSPRMERRAEALRLGRLYHG